MARIRTVIDGNVIEVEADTTEEVLKLYVNLTNTKAEPTHSIDPPGESPVAKGESELRLFRFWVSPGTWATAQIKVTAYSLSEAMRIAESCAVESGYTEAGTGFFQTWNWTQSNGETLLPSVVGYIPKPEQPAEQMSLYEVTASVGDVQVRETRAVLVKATSPEDAITIVENSCYQRGDTLPGVSYCGNPLEWRSREVITTRGIIYAGQR